MNEKKCPITDELWFRFIEDRLTPDEEASLREHLDSECAECDAFFEKMGDMPARTGLLWAAESVIPKLEERFAPPAHVKEEIFRNVMEKFELNAVRTAHISRIKNTAYTAVTFIALVFAFMTFALLPDRPRDVGTKSGLEKFTQFVILHAAVIESGTGGLPRRGVRRKYYSQNDVIFFRYEISEPAYVGLFIYDDENGMERIYPKEFDELRLQEPGVYEFRRDDMAEGYSLSGKEGKIIFVIFAVKSVVDIDMTVPNVLKNYINEASNELPPDVAVDTFEIYVKDSY